MPLYEYQCDACGVRFERIQRFADPPIDRCLSCGQGPVHKLLSAPAVHFKGTGWYVTDYAGKKSDGSVRTDAAEYAAAPASAASSSSGGDAKAGGSESASDAGQEREPARRKSTGALSTASDRAPAGTP